MKIAFILHNLSFLGGTQRLVLNLARSAKKQGYRVTVYTLAVDKNTYPNLLEGLDVVALSDREPEALHLSQDAKFLGLFSRPNYCIYWQWRNRIFKKLAMLVDEDTELLCPVGFHAYVAAHYFKKMKKNIPSVYLLLTFPLKGWLLWRAGEVNPAFRLSQIKRFFYWCMDRIEVIRFFRDQTIVVFYDHNAEKTKKYMGKSSHLVRFGIDTDLFWYCERSIAVKKKARIFLVGILFPYRRFEDAFAAMKILVDAGYDLEAVHIGSSRVHPEYHQKLLDVVRELDLAKRVRFLGPLPEEDLMRYYHECDIAVFPHVFQPGLGVVFESMSCGMPTIVSRGSGDKEILQDTVHTLFVDPLSPAQIADAMKSLIDDPELYRELSRNGREFVEKNMSWKRFAGGIFDVFEKEFTPLQPGSSDFTPSDTLSNGTRAGL